MVNIQKIIAPNNYLCYMKLGANDLEIMITECVQRILEHHHAIDDSLEQLASLIIDKFKGGGGNIDPEAINAVNPYFKVTTPLKIIPVRGVNYVASYSKNNNEIEINSDRNILLPKMKENIMHELSHFVDLNLRTKPRDPAFRLSEYGEVDAMANIADDIIYLFSPTEIQARLTQFKQLLKRIPGQSRKDLTEYFNEKCLRLTRMKELLEIFNDCRYGYKSDEIVQMVAYSTSYSRIIRKGGNIDNAAWGENMSEEEFIIQKKKIGRVLEKRLRNMWQKASKLKFDALA